MTDNDRPLILLTNDDGIRSPALWAAAEALSEIGFVTVAAPREQSSGAGRSMPITSDGKLTEEQVEVRGKKWNVYAVGGSPAQAVQHGILELMPRQPDLVVAGINYGENLTTGITVSGTVGAALEGASFGVPALAISLEVPAEHYFSHSNAIDFSVAKYFTAYFARILLEMQPLADVDVLKVDIPSDASETTEWRMTRLSRQKYYVPVVPPRAQLGDPTNIQFEIELNRDKLEPDSDVYALRIDRKVSVTPLSLDITSRVDFAELEYLLKAKESQG
ncbi:MAG TPA: 5'/3'-nucleotidase SurE [Anaerolineales bacterium]|nr:5'/3'-nucleotidase SurE [Anaerolineales bacterium]